MKKSLFLLLALASALSLASAVRASLVYEKFTTDPALDGWQSFGDSNLFQWDATNGVLDVTWDSTQPNSYYYHPLGVTLTTNDGFCVQFDLTVSNVMTFGYGQQLAVGLFNYAEATNNNYLRTWGTLPDVCEFDYFPADQEGDPASDDATTTDSATKFFFAYDNQTLNPGITYRVVLVHWPDTLFITGTIFTNGQVMTTLPIVFANYPTMNDAGAFQLDTLSISSYADDESGDDVYAQGTVANLACAWPLPVNTIQAIAAGKVQLASDTNWVYTLEQTADFQTWTPAAPAVTGNGTNLVLQATNTTPAYLFYQVQAHLP